MFILVLSFTVEQYHIIIQHMSRLHFVLATMLVSLHYILTENTVYYYYHHLVIFKIINKCLFILLKVMVVYKNDIYNYIKNEHVV